ncbi:MAG: protein kinase [Prosthecobacter sp.]|uniref:protein kinase domain-containing protein n=1 Tax=Prosthecobacter sp. TaxID=1965333 RepID=UPI0019E0FA57|nr:protein kinase [Prosthecobacter sp.]MBE2283518.1 protein kinase [Prosthecobacter sp.]
MTPEGNPSRNNDSTRSAPRSPAPESDSLLGLDPVGLLDGVMAGHASEWKPPPARELESLFPGFTGFEYLDRGAMGAVYAATQVSLQRRVAIKILPPEFGEDAAFVTRFQQEALMLARLHHPHIVAVHDFGRNAAGGVYIVMEYVNGTSLLEIMQERRLPVDEVLEIIRQTCLALQFAHDHGVVHRDIKPTNILIDERKRVRVADFGLAKLHLKEPGSHSAVQSSLGGTPVYAAPEQMRRNGVVDHRCDIYSTGVTMYELLTGQLPVGNFDPPSKKASTPMVLDKIVLKAMRESPDDRHQKASELAADIEDAARRIATPILNRAIVQRPIVSMMTTVIVTAGFIFLFGEINQQVLRNRPKLEESRTAEAALIKLNDTFSVMNLRMTWEDARQQAARQGFKLASIHSAAELDEIVRGLHAREISNPVWTGGTVTETGSLLGWDDGSPVDFEAWMPVAPQPPLIITELQAKNWHTWKTPEGTTPDWVEVFNPGTQPVSLHGWHLRHISKDGTVEGRLVVRENDPAGMITPGEYRVIPCNVVREPGRIQFGFSLDSQGGRFAWSDPRGRVIQAFDRAWREFPPDMSLISDTTGFSWGWTVNPTPGQPNPGSRQPLRVDPRPVPAPSAVLLLPEFEGRWAADMVNRRAVPLFRKVKP